MGISKEPIKFIRLIDDRMQKTPREVAAINTRRPRKFEKIKLIMSKNNKMKVDNIE